VPANTFVASNDVIVRRGMTFFPIHRSRSISFTRAQGIPKYKIGFFKHQKTGRTCKKQARTAGNKRHAGIARAARPPHVPTTAADWHHWRSATAAHFSQTPAAPLRVSSGWRRRARCPWANWGPAPRSQQTAAGEWEADQSSPRPWQSMPTGRPVAGRRADGPQGPSPRGWRPLQHSKEGTHTSLLPLLRIPFPYKMCGIAHNYQHDWLDTTLPTRTAHIRRPTTSANNVCEQKTCAIETTAHITTETPAAVKLTTTRERTSGCELQLPLDEPAQQCVQRCVAVQEPRRGLLLVLTYKDRQHRCCIQQRPHLQGEMGCACTEQTLV
jgi:hypothetical protein